jgi:hypothetical protein
MTASQPTSQITPLWKVLRHPRNQDEINQRHVLIDGIGVGITIGIGSFLSVFLVRLGATNFQVGLLTAMPALTGMLLAIPVGGFLSHRRHIVPWYARPRFLVLSSYVLTGLVPFLFEENQVEAIIAIWAVATLPQTIVSVAFTIVMGGVAGAGGRFALMSRRWAILGLTNSITVLVAGQMLGLFAFPLNYQIIFLASAAGALISVLASSGIVLPPQETPAGSTGIRKLLGHGGAGLRQHRSFVNFTSAQFVFRFGLALAIPLFPIYWVRNAGASDAQIGAINAAQTLVMMVAYFFWAAMVPRRGERWVLLVTAFGVSFYPLVTAFTTSPEVLILWAGLAGFFIAGVDLVFFDMILRTCPPENRASFIGLYQTTVYLATFLAPLMGTALVDRIGIVAALAIGSLIRFAGFGLLARLRVAG